MAKINTASYLLSAAWQSQWPEATCPEICLAGRSNVGKSSFINTILYRNGIAKVSSNPGKTRTLNFFDVNGVLRLVDVPGYGYAKVPEKILKSFGEMMDLYISNRETLKGLILIVDYRHKPTKDDIQMYEYVKYHKIPVIVVATKEDKLKRNELKKNEKLIKDTLNLQPSDTFIRFSSLKKIGIDEVWKQIQNLTDTDF